MKIKDQIESEPLDLHKSSYDRQRGYTDGLLSHELKNGDPVKACRQYLAASRRAMLHSLEAAHCPAEIIEAIFAPDRMTIIEIYNRLKSDQANQAAFPRPNHAMVAAFEAVGVKAKPSDPITTMEIEAMTGVSFRHLSTALASLSGLLAIYGADYRLHRVNLSEGNCPRYGYYIAPVK